MSARAARAAPLPRRLIITADDFGAHEGVNEAVERASSTGVLTAASLMVGAPACADAVRRARRLGRLRVGLHLVLADGWPVLPPRFIPALVGADGRFDDRMVIRGVSLFARRDVRKQAAAEIRAQFKLFARTGLMLDHVNAHKHFHLHPTLLRMVLEIGREFGVRAVRVPSEPLWFCRQVGVPPAAALAATLLLPWTSHMKRRLCAAGIAHNDHVFGIARSGRMDEPTLLRILGRLPAGITEIYLHPAMESAPATTPSGGAYGHAEELAALCSPRVRAAITAAGAACGGYSDVVRQVR